MTHISPIIEKLGGERMTQDAVFLIGFWKKFRLSVLLNNLLISIDLTYIHIHTAIRKGKSIKKCCHLYVKNFLPHATGPSPRTELWHSHSSDTYWQLCLNTLCPLHAQLLKHINTLHFGSISHFTSVFVDVTQSQSDSPLSPNA